MFGEVDVRSWRLAHEETLGTKPKRWLQEPGSGAYWLMKDVTVNRRADGTVYAKGDDWAERVACEIARAIGVPAAAVELAVGGTAEAPVLGVLSGSVLADDESLIHGNELLEEVGVAGADAHDRAGYTWQAVRDALAQVAPPNGFSSAWEAFVGYLVLDALAGNTDRHQENWAVVARGRERRLAPSFDHASSMGFQLDDEQRLERLRSSDTLRSPEAYAGRARSRFEGGPAPVLVAVEALASLPTRERDRWLDACAVVDDLIEPLWQVPQTRMSTVARDFAERVVRANQSALLSHPFGTV